MTPEQWLHKVQQATGLHTLVAGKLTIEGDVLIALDLGGYHLASLPESIGELTTLTRLHLSENELATLPASIGKLKELQILDLLKNKITTLPESFGQLTALTKLDLGENKLTSVPECIFKLSLLTDLNLSTNDLQGEVPMDLGKLELRKKLNLSYNPSLGGSLPAVASVIDYRGTNINGVRIKVNRLNLVLKNPYLSPEYYLMAWQTLMGYGDLATDVLSIIQLGLHNQPALMGLNIAFLLLNTGINVLLQQPDKDGKPDTHGRIMAALQLQPAVQAWETLRTGVQTQSLVRSSKVDAVCRSMPSIALQLYGLLLTLPTLSVAGVKTIAMSVAMGLMTSAMALGSLAPKSDDGIFSRAFVVHVCYFASELFARLVSISLLFTALGPTAFGVLVVDLAWKLGWAWSSADFAPLTDFSSCRNVILEALLWFGSDGKDGPGGDAAVILQLYNKKDPRELGGAEVNNFFVSFGSFLVLILSLFFVNLVKTPALIALRASKGGPIQALTALVVIALLAKLGIGHYIYQTDFKGPGAEENQPDATLAKKSSVSVVGSSAPPDAIPKRLQASAPASPAAPRLGSVRVMHDNPLHRPSASGSDGV